MRIYLDHNATAPLHPAAAAVLRAHAEGGEIANPSSLHAAGQVARSRLEDARRTLAVAIGVTPAELIFTASGSEANLLALRGVLPRASGLRRRILVSAIEHPSVLATLEACAKDHPFLAIELLPVDRQGRLDLSAAERSLGPDVLLVSLMLANNETGVVQPVRELALLARQRGALVHCDAAQVLGKASLVFETLGADLLTAGGHKFGAGSGCGVLVARRGVPFVPLLAGHQEAGRRGGTENVAAIRAAAAALAAQLPGLATSVTRTARLRDRLERGLCEAVPRARVNGAGADRLSNTTNLEFAGADGEALVIALDLAGIAASTGAACASGTLEPSHVLLAMGLSRSQAKASVRFSLGASTTEQEIETVLRLLPPIVERTRLHAPTM